jgi:hypothetical protein
MNKEYIVISKTAIQKRIEELEKVEQQQVGNLNGYIALGETRALNKILSQSTPLIPEIEKAFDKGLEVIQENSGKLKVTMPKAKQDYITQLKLDI